VRRLTLILFIALVAVFPLCLYAGSTRHLALGFEDVTRMALENNLDIQIAKFDARIKKYDLGEAYSVFDTFLNANISYDKNNLDTPSVLIGKSSSTNNYSFSLSKKTSLGTTLGVSAYNTRSWTNSSFVTQNPNTEANVELSISQPLLKNFFGMTDRGNIEITKLDIKNFSFTSLDNIEASLASAQEAYWRLVLKYEELKIKKNMLKEAQKLYAIYKGKIKNGLVEEPDLLASEANVASKRNDIFQANLEISQAKNNLLYLLNVNDTGIDIIVRDNLHTQPKAVDFYKELSFAINRRRDYKIIKNELSLENIRLSLKKNALWPQIDLEASFTRNGIGSAYKDAWSKISSQNQHEWYVGVNISFPLEKRLEKAQYQKSKLSKEKLLVILKKTERLIFKEINDRTTKVNILSSQVVTNEKIVQLQVEKLKAEEERLKYGRSSSDIIIRYQDDLLRARLNLAESLFYYRAARISLERKENALLSKYWKGKI